MQDDSWLERQGVARLMHVANIIKRNSDLCNAIGPEDEVLQHIKSIANSLSDDCKAYNRKYYDTGVMPTDFYEQLKAKCGYNPLLFRGFEPARRMHEFTASLKAVLCPDGGFDSNDYPGRDEFSEAMNYDKVNAIWGHTSLKSNFDDSNCEDSPPDGQCGHRALAILMDSAQRWVAAYCDV